MTALAILYGHPAWFAPLFAALDRHGIPTMPLRPGTAFDSADPSPPAPLVFNRAATGRRSASTADYYGHGSGFMFYDAAHRKQG